MPKPVGDNTPLVVSVLFPVFILHLTEEISMKSCLIKHQSKIYIFILAVVALGIASEASLEVIHPTYTHYI